jgi:transposase-like protein
VFGGVERESGETFLVPVPDRTADTLMNITSDWIQPCTTVISDGWAAYRDLDSHGYTHHTVNHSIQFFNPDNGANIFKIKIEKKKKKVKVLLGIYNRREDYEYHLAHYMLATRCKARGVSSYIEFIHLVANTDWSQCSLLRSTDRAT